MLKSHKKLPKKYAPHRLREFLIMLFLSAALTAGLFYLKMSLDTRNQASSTDVLLARISQSYLEPTDMYYLYVHHLKANGSVAPYSGLLDVSVKSCNASNVCTSSTVPWGSYQAVNGVVKVNINNFGKGDITASFRPRGSDWQWSNKVEVSIGITNKLENAKQWWLMPANSPVTFYGKNNVNGESFKTVLGYDAQSNNCGMGTGRMMYFMKDKTSGYWGANVPWLFASDGDAVFRTQTNILWSLIDWKKQAGWHDTYLTSAGYESYQYNPTNLARSANFTGTPKYGRRISSGTPEYPPYVLAPEWVGDGWGVFNNKQQSKPVPNQKMCSVTPIDCTTTSCKGFWSAQSDVVFLPGYPTPLLKMTYYEATDSFYTNPNGAFGWREDYFFQKGTGLVRIDVKHFGPPQNQKPHTLLKLCSQDQDCLANKIMKTPHITLHR